MRCIVDHLAPPHVLRPLSTHLLAFEGDSHVDWFEDNFEDYDADKVRRLGADAVNPHRMSYKKLKR